MIFSRGFVTLFALQALVFVAGFAGLVLYQVHRLRDANRYRLQVLSEKTMLIAAAPRVLMCMQQCGLARFSQSMQLKVSSSIFVKQVLIEPVTDDGVALIFKLTVLRDGARRGGWAYFFVERHGKTPTGIVYRGMQFGASL